MHRPVEIGARGYTERGKQNETVPKKIRFGTAIQN